jgi:hypothetical protein
MSTPSQKQRKTKIRARMIKLNEGRWVVLYPSSYLTGTATIQVILQVEASGKWNRRFERSRRVLLVEMMERCKDLFWGRKEVE